MKIQELCLCCFNQKTEGGPCSVCGYEASTYKQSPHHLAVESILAGRYLVGKVLGEGGFGITYMAFDLNLEIKVAVKEYYPNGCVTRESTNTATVYPYAGENGEYFERGKEKFLEEAKVLAKFSFYPGIVSVRDFFTENQTAYIVMEYVEGETLKAFLARKGGEIPSAKVFSMMLPVMQSLGKIHQSGMIHRDISPDNIMIDSDGQVKLLDFGAARDFASDRNKSLSVMLKPGYAPEEQYRSRGVQGPWTDIYALCATMYRCMTGEVPIESNERVVEDELKLPSKCGVKIKDYEEKALMKGLEVFQKNRYQDVFQLVADLYPTEEALKQQGEVKEEPKPIKHTVVDNDPPESPKVEPPKLEPMADLKGAFTPKQDSVEAYEREEENKKRKRIIIWTVILCFLSIIGLYAYYDNTYVLDSLYAEAITLTTGDTGIIDVSQSPYTSKTDISCVVIEGEEYISAYWNGSDVEVTSEGIDVLEGEELAQVRISGSNGVSTVVDVNLENLLREIDVEPIELETGDTKVLDMVQTPSNHISEILCEVIEGEEYITANWDGENLEITAGLTEIPEGEEAAQVRLYTEDGVEVYVDITLENVSMKISEETIVLELGETYQLSPVMMPEETAETREFTYEESSPGFSVSSSGKITASSTGSSGVTRTGTVTITSDNGLEKTVSVEVRDSFYVVSSEDSRSYSDSNGSWATYTKVFTSEIENCTGLTVSYKLNENESYVGKTFKVVGLSSAGKWTKLGTFVCGEIDEEVITELTFTATDIIEVAFVPTSYYNYGSWNASKDIITGTYE